jgi:hypothetical protein
MSDLLDRVEISGLAALMIETPASGASLVAELRRDLANFIAVLIPPAADKTAPAAALIIPGGLHAMVPPAGAWVVMAQGDGLVPERFTQYLVSAPDLVELLEGVDKLFPQARWERSELWTLEGIGPAIPAWRQGLFLSE